MRNIFRIKLLLLPLYVIFASGCASMQIYRVIPEERTELINGREISEKEDSTAYVSFEFDGQSEDNFVFYVHVANNSGGNLYVSPVDISAEMLRHDMSPVRSGEGSVVFALDPERQIEAIEKEMSEAESWHNVSTGFNIFAAVVDVVSTLSGDHKHKALEAGAEVAYWGTKQAVETEIHKDNMRSMDSDREFWKNEVLRDTELYPDEQIGGLVFIPKNNRAKFIKLNFRIGDSDYSFLFKQVEID